MAHLGAPGLGAILFTDAVEKGAALRCRAYEGSAFICDTECLTQMYNKFTLTGMSKTRKIQVTLEEDQYEKLAEIANRDGKKLAAVVRESVVRYCLGPESKRAKRKALKTLFAGSAPAPEDYATWEREYAELKTETKDSKTRARKGR